MELRVWQSFSCNNSSSYYMVARFETAKAATESAGELSAFFDAHGEQSDAMWRDGGDPISTPTKAATELASKHGFEWTGYLAWGDEGMADWTPTVSTLDKTLILYHRYCGGFGESIPKYFAALGASYDEQDRGNMLLAVRFAIPGSSEGQAAAAAVATYIEGLNACAVLEEGWAFQYSDETTPPWDGEVTRDMEFKCGTPYPGWNDGEMIGFIVEVTEFGEWESIPLWLEKNGIADFHLSIDEPEIVERFRAIAAATCRECGAAPLRFIDATVHQTPDDQLACEGCGGMFDVGELVKEQSVED